MLPASNRAPRFDPPTPQTLLDSGLSQSLVLDLVLRIAFLEGVVGLQMLSSRTKLSVLILQALLREMQREQLCEAKAIGDEDYEFTLSARGRALADVALRKTHYAGPAPVALTQYNTAVRLQRIEVQVTADTLRSKFEDLVLADKELGPVGRDADRLRSPTRARDERSVIRPRRAEARANQTKRRRKQGLERRKKPLLPAKPLRLRLLLRRRLSMPLPPLNRRVHP